MTLNVPLNNDELLDIQRAIVAKLGVSADQVTVSELRPGILRVTVGSDTFEGSVNELYVWLDSLLKRDATPGKDPFRRGR